MNYMKELIHLMGYLTFGEGLKLKAKLVEQGAKLRELEEENLLLAQESRCARRDANRAVTCMNAHRDHREKAEVKFAELLATVKASLDGMDEIIHGHLPSSIFDGEGDGIGNRPDNHSSTVGLRGVRNSIRQLQTSIDLIVARLDD